MQYVHYKLEFRLHLNLKYYLLYKPIVTNVSFALLRKMYNQPLDRGQTFLYMQTRTYTIDTYGSYFILAHDYKILYFNMDYEQIRIQNYIKLRRFLLIEISGKQANNAYEMLAGNTERDLRNMQLGYKIFIG